jgi:hypothetical protein
MYGENPSDHVLVDFDAECECNLLGNSATAPTAISPFHLDDCIDEFFIWSFRTRSSPTFGRKQSAVFPLDEHLVETQQSGWLQSDGGSENACRTNK